jgi:hypothetical protein
MPDPAPSIRSRIRDILLQDWDPSNASRFESARHEYDQYLDPLAELIQSNAPQEAIIDFLHQRELETMCFPGLDHIARLRPVARKLAALRNE